ncbi:MAG: DUF4280 domain-containing protein [Holosporales bacterium]|nr:DUF4280 domain-containing protein [Holosporales bacterium]
MEWSPLCLESGENKIMGMPAILSGLCKCVFGAAPTPLIVPPIDCVVAKNMPMATIMNHIPFMNITPFGTCMNIANPMVAAATAAALGVLTPMPCIPITTGPWLPIKPTIVVKNKPALDNTSMLMCQWGGVIQVSFPGLTMCTM